jgi:predicted permease
MFFRSRRERELDRELRNHLELEAEEGTAEDAARRALGNLTKIREDVREAWGWAGILRFARDLRHAFRVLRWNPGFAVVAILALALGVGANTALYSILNAIFLRALPVEKPEQLVVLSSNNQSYSYPQYQTLREASQTLQGVIAHRILNTNIGPAGAVERGKVALVSGNYFSLLGLRTAIGAPIAAEDDLQPGSGGARGPVAVLGFALWNRRFGADPAVLGRAIELNGTPFTVVGVMDPAFSGLEVGMVPDAYIPMMMEPVIWPDNRAALAQRRNVWIRLMGRLRPGVSRELAEAELTVLLQQFNQPELPSVTAERRKRLLAQRVELLPGIAGISGLRQRYSQPLTVLMVVAGFVLLIACANVASLLLTRATGRQREIAVRLALGATRGRLVSQLLSESLLLALAGSGAGMLLARWLRDLILSFLPQAADVSVTLDARVLGFSLVLSIATGLLFGLVPALQATRPQMTPALKGEDFAGGKSRFNLRQGLVVLQVALSLLLLTGAGVFIRSLKNLERMDPGFVRENILVFSLAPKMSGYQQDAAQVFYQRLLDRLRTLPGVLSAGMADFLPLDNHTENTIYVEGYRPGPDEPTLDPGASVITPAYFATMGIPVLMGRDFNDRDTAAAPGAAIVNETFARHYFGTQNPLGHRIGNAKDHIDIEIVGVVKDSKYGGLRETPARMVYRALAQRGAFGAMTVHVRTAGDPIALGSAVRAEVRNLNRNLPVTDMHTVRDLVDRAMVQDRLVATLSALFSALALALCAVGLYGVMSYAVSRRAREIGIRMALGGTRGSIARQVVKEAAVLVAAGVLVGLPVCYAVLKLVSGLLFGLAPADAVSTAAAVAVLAAAAFAAAWIPARRASRVDPMTALRWE